MSTEPVFTGTPDDWWDNATPIPVSEAEERTLGNWYITKVRTAGDTKPTYRLSTPSRPPNREKRSKLAEWDGDRTSDRVRLLISSAVPEPAWRKATYVLADLEQGSDRRVAWVRKATGRWHCLEDGRRTINDHAMELLHPLPAAFTVTEDLL